jgi:hypothetical protein
MGRSLQLRGGGPARLVTSCVIAAAVFVVAISVARADGLGGSSVTYDVRLLKEDKAAYAEGQASSTLSSSCKERSFGEILLLAIERKNASAKTITEKAERIEEKVSAQEALDGSTLKYQTRLRHDARIDTANGTATLGAEPGQLHTVLSRYKQDSPLPAGTLAPAAARAALVEALIANKPGKIEIGTVEMYRFHKPIMQIFTRLAPEDASIARDLPKELKAPSKQFAAGRLWALKRQVPEFNEFGDEFWLLHESGAVVRQVVTRYNVKLLFEAKEVSIFPPPACP